MVPRLFSLVPLVFAVGCGAAFGKARCAANPVGDLLVVGDSILFYNAPACASIGDVAGAALDMGVHVAAKTGAKVNPEGRYVFGDIREQYVSHPWRWLVLNGGINDLNQDCGCDECDHVLDSIVSEDGQTGDVPDLIDRATADGAQIVLVGYAELDPEASWGFGVCNDAADALETRYRRLAERRQDVVFVDPSDAISLAGTPEAYARDGVHPSEAGSAVIGQLVADAIRASAD